jgi:competence protein ComEC
MIEKVPLLNTKRDFYLLALLTFFLLFYSLLIEYNNYLNLTKFNSSVITAEVLKQYTKTKQTKKGKIQTYQVLKLKSPKGFTFYTSFSNKTPKILAKKIKLEVWMGKISFYEYMNSFYSFSKLLYVYKKPSLKEELQSFIASQHKDKNITSIYNALFSASSLTPQLQSKFSALGISHLIAISGFHLGVLSALLFFLIKLPYKFFQGRYFPYRSYKRDSFIIIATLLLVYLLFLDMPPSLLRAYGMLLIGFILYDRGIEVISMQTLFLSVILLVALFPRLLFSIGFFLSVSGVFYIFLFLLYFKHRSKLWQFLLLPLWVYICMLPYSLVIFGIFSLYHPLSILLTSLFTLFYPLSLVLHLFSLGALLDPVLEWLIYIQIDTLQIKSSYGLLGVQVLLSLAALYKKSFMIVLLLFDLAFFIYAIYYVT